MISQVFKVDYATLLLGADSEAGVDNERLTLSGEALELARTFDRIAESSTESHSLHCKVLGFEGRQLKRRAADRPNRNPAVIIDFDQNDWMPSLDEVLRNLVTPSAKESLRQASFDYIENARDALIALSDGDAVIDAFLAWIRSNELRVYHGSRLTDNDVQDVLSEGLRPLNIGDRLKWLRSEFPEIDGAISPAEADEVIRREMLSVRENQVHASLSRQAVLTEYEYLDGSEFDRRFLQWAGHSDLVELLKQRGKSRLVTLKVPGDEALTAMHPIFPIEHLREKGEYPNLVEELLSEYAWHLHDPTSERETVDSCLMFLRPVPSDWIESVEIIETGSLSGTKVTSPRR